MSLSSWSLTLKASQFPVVLPSSDQTMLKSWHSAYNLHIRRHWSNVMFLKTHNPRSELHCIPQIPTYRRARLFDSKTGSKQNWREIWLTFLQSFCYALFLLETGWLSLHCYLACTVVPISRDEYANSDILANYTTISTCVFNIYIDKTAFLDRIMKPA